MMNTMKMKLMSALLAVSVIFGSFALPTTVAAYDFDDDDYWYYDDDDEYLDDYEDLIRMELIAHHYDKKYNSYVNVTGVAVSSTAVQLPIGGSYQITGYVKPENANNQGVCYYSTNPMIATVDGNGVIRALNPGTCTIVTKTSEGGYECYTSMTVLPATVQLPVVR